MARATFAGTAADWLQYPVNLGRDKLVALRQASTTLTFWNAKTGGAQHTDLLVDGVATSVITCTDYQIPTFQGPDAIAEMWGDDGRGSPRFRLVSPLGAVEPSAEGVQDIVAAMIKPGANITVSYNDPAGELTITGTGGGGSAATISSLLYVKATGGNDASDGLSWTSAKATIAAAVAAAPAGAAIILGPGSHDVGAGVDIPRATLPALIGVTPLYARQHASGSHLQARIYSTAGTKPSRFFRVPAGSGNAYGWTVKQLYIDLDSLADNCPAFETHALNMVLMEDVRGRALAPNVDEPNTRSLIFADRAGGDDSSWWTVRNCGVQGAKLGEIWGNYCQFPGSFAGGSNSTKPTGPALHIVQGTQPDFHGFDTEGWETGIKCTGVRGAMAIAHTGESLDTILHLVDCFDCTVIVNSTAGSGQARVKDENGLRNTFITNLPVERINNPTVNGLGLTGPAGSFQISQRGSSPSQLAGGYINTIFGNNSAFPDSGPELLPLDSNEVCVACGLT